MITTGEQRRASALLLTTLTLSTLLPTNMKNAIVPTSQPTVDPMSIHQRIRRGQAIALLYIAAQHLSQAASDDACRLIEEANDPWQNFGFNKQMRKSPYMTRAVGHPTHDIHMQKESKDMRDERIKRMITPHWMFEKNKSEADSFGEQFRVVMPWDTDPANILPC